MGRIGVAGPPKLLRDRDQFSPVGEAARRVLEPGRQSHRTTGQPLAHEGPHPVDLRWRRRPVGASDDVAAHRPVADHRRDRHGGALPVDPVEEAGNVTEVDLDVEVAPVTVTGGLEGAVAPGSDGAAVLPDDLQGHSLADPALRTRVDQQGKVGMGMDVDEPGGDGHAAGIDLDGTGCGDLPHRRDAAPRDGDVTGARRRSGSVEDRAAANDEVRPAGCTRRSAPESA